MFTWIPMYEEIASKILEFENRQTELLDLLGKLRAEGLKVIQLNDRDANDKIIPLAQIDPLTFFASFNRTSSVPGRQAILQRLKAAWNLTSSAPDDFAGIPLANAQNSWAFAYSADREPTDVPILWRVAREAVAKNWQTFDQNLFNEALGISQMGLARMSMSLFWMKPRAYLSFDKNTRAYFEQRGIVCDSKTASGYVSWMGKVVAQVGDDFPQISHDAYLAFSGDEKIGKAAGLVIGEQPAPASSGHPSQGVAYWWLNANPKIWDIRGAPAGTVNTYTTHNEAGNKRQKYKHFASIKPGDLVLGYVTSPEKEIVALCEITKGLHTTNEGEVIEFKKIEEFKEPVTWAELQSAPELKHCEPIQSNQGSLFTVTEEEYDFIRSIIDERNFVAPAVNVAVFTKADALAGLFMPETQLDLILTRLKQKKALVLQGPPGVGKTFVAKRLAYALMGQKDDRRVAMVQFHPSYGYEDFIQGYRPSRVGGLERRDGVFYEFARLARNDPDRDWFFIIDEINRGNLAKIFGELLMLLEADKRGPDQVVSLTYSEKGEKFYLPKNLHVIGTMNTADRSLAMVDYALRRRFAFVTLEPAVDTNAFGEWFIAAGASKALLDEIRAGVGVLNAAIDKERDLGERFRIGHSFFCPSPGQKPDTQWYREIIQTEIKPLLEEYFESKGRVESLIAEVLK